MDENDNGCTDWSLKSSEPQSSLQGASSLIQAPSQTPPGALSFIKSNIDQRWIHTCGGAVGGLASAIIVCPLDIVKIRLQNQGKASISTLGTHSTSRYSGMVNALYTIWKEEGFRKGWYRGLRATTAAYIVDRSIWFPTYHSMKSVFARGFGVDVTETIVHLNASVFASVVCLFLTNPLWIVRTRIMTSSAKNPRSEAYSTSVSYQLTKMLRHEGLSSWFTGIGPSLIGISHVAVQFPLYERLKSALIHQQRTDTSQSKQGLHSVSLLIASSVSKMVASLVTYPHEVIRTRMYTEKHQLALAASASIPQMSTPSHPSTSSMPSQSTPNPKHQLKYASMIQATRTVLVEEGWKGFYKGLGTTLLRTVPSTAISLYLYEWIVHHLGDDG